MNRLLSEDTELDSFFHTMGSSAIMIAAIVIWVMLSFVALGCVIVTIILILLAVGTDEVAAPVIMVATCITLASSVATVVIGKRLARHYSQAR